MGDVIHVDFRPEPCKLSRDIMREALAKGFAERGLDSPALLDCIADRYGEEISAMEQRLTFGLTLSDRLSDESVATISAKVRELGMEAMLAITRAFHTAALVTAHAVAETRRPENT